MYSTVVAIITGMKWFLLSIYQIDRSEIPLWSRVVLSIEGLCIIPVKFHDRVGACEINCGNGQKFQGQMKKMESAHSGPNLRL